MTQGKPPNMVRKILQDKGRYRSSLQGTQFVWNDEKLEIFYLLLNGVAKKEMKARGHHHEKIRWVERQIKTGNYPPQVKEFGVLVHIESPDGGPVGIIRTW